jgi:hypothetical protein
MKLTERKIATLIVNGGRKDRLVFDDAQRGLAVRVTATGGRTYLCQYTLHGQKWRVPLGSCSALSLFKAREAAAALIGDVAKGRNPAAERKEAAAAEWAKRVRGRLTLAMLFQDWARLPSSTADHDTPPRPYAPSTVASLSTSTAPLRTSTALRSCMRWIHSAAPVRRKEKEKVRSGTEPPSLAAPRLMAEPASLGR